ncbi:unnamed protein product [Rhizophagus irregularis]|uniref:Uncharacterized protein n=1 Tax=Rhizophagus irregularis TaxID=588596 RepID=A0A915ZWQ7_9GLOM|nr:unnamed protein product [Rhizophagus irregularis]CAB5394006.1 unnamed protein product [Rhizophagus irregularis]
MNNLKEFNGSIDVKNEIEEKDCLWNNTAIIVCIAVGIGAIAIAGVVTLAMIITDQDLTAVIKVTPRFPDNLFSDIPFARQRSPDKTYSRMYILPT